MFQEQLWIRLVSAELMSSPQASPVSPIVELPESTPKESTIPDGSGLTSPDWFASFDRSSSSWRTRQNSLPLMTGQLAEKFSVTWPQSITMRKGICYQRPPLVRGISGSDYGLLPTPVKSDWANRKPSLRPHRTRSGTYRHLNESGKQSFMRLSQVVKLIARVVDGYLNPVFVEWLMGYPLSYTNLELKRSEILLSPPSLSTSGNALTDTDKAA